MNVKIRVSISAKYDIWDFDRNCVESVDQLGHINNSKTSFLSIENEIFYFTFIFLTFYFILEYS